MAKKKSSPKKKTTAPLSGAMKRRFATGGVALLCLAAVIGTGVYVSMTLDQLDQAKVDGDGATARVDSVNDTLLNGAIEKDAARRSEERAVPADVANPFYRAPAPAPVPPPTDTPASEEEAPAPVQ